jgi:ribulose-phosphate 3-epimerase
MVPLVAPSLLAADFARLGEEVRAVETAGADWLHLDIMDGHFVPNISFGPGLVKGLRAHTRLPFDVHLMIEPAGPFLEAFAEAGAATITVHVEACPHLDRTLARIRELGCAAGVALNPSTPESALAYVLDRIDLVCVMTVNPGFGGQAFLDSQLDKIRRLRERLVGRPVRIEVDGGIGPRTAAPCLRAGAEVLVAGSSVFGTGDYRTAIDALRHAGAVAV